MEQWLHMNTTEDPFDPPDRLETAQLVAVTGATLTGEWEFVGLGQWRIRAIPPCSPPARGS